MSTATVVGRDDVGVIAVDETGFAYYLTDCCGASAKGCADYTGCRACYRPIDDLMGGTPNMAMVEVDGRYEFVPKPLVLTEVYGDGIPYNE